MKQNEKADPSSEKGEAYTAAVALLAKSDDSSLRYAALEVRRCMEAVVYEKLKAYGTLLPEGSVYQWQPPQAFDALIDIEPNAELSGTIAVAIQPGFGKPPEGPWQKIGTDERPKAKWLRKTWHKIGFYLHADWPFGTKARSPLRPFLEKTLAELTVFVNTTFTMTVSMSIDFVCSSCGAPVKVMERAVETNRQATCLSCGIRYRAEKENGSFTFYPDEPPFDCECGAKTFLPNRHLKAGYRFSCNGCKKEFQIFGIDWKVGPATSTGRAEERDGE